MDKNVYAMIQAEIESGPVFSPEQWAENALKKILDLMDGACGIKLHTADGQCMGNEK